VACEAPTDFVVLSAAFLATTLVVTFLVAVTAGLTVALVATLAAGFATTLVAGFATALVAGFAATLAAGLVATFVAAFACVTGFILSFGDCAANFGGAFLALTTLIGVLVGAAFLAADEVGALATFLLAGKALDTLLLLLLLTLLAATDLTTAAVLAVVLTAVFTIVLALVAFLAVVCLAALLLVLVSRRVVVIIALCLSHLIRIYRHQTAGGAEPHGNCKQVRVVVIRQNVTPTR
jgi:hypothetical protein